MLGNHGKKLKIRIGIIDQAVSMAFRAIMAHSRKDRTLFSVEYHGTAAREDINHLAIALVPVHSDGCAGYEFRQHDPVLPVERHLGQQLLVPALEGRERHEIGPGEIYVHGKALNKRFEFPQETEVVFEIVAEILDLPFQHGDTFDTHAESETAVFSAVYS